MSPIASEKVARPCLKWVGGKHESVEHILRYLSAKIDTYYEPFFGGGAVFFALAAAKRFKRAVISDSCLELIEMYRTIRDDVEAVIAAIRRLGPSRISEKKYYRIRASRPRTPAGRAARTLFLNKNGFNGLYRVNSFGKFNVPWGKRTSWKPDYENLVAVSAALCDVEIVAGDFESPLRDACLGDAVYLDPPYLPKSKTEKFTAYTRNGFGFDQQLRLANVYRELTEIGVHVVASNADTPLAMKLYGDIPGTKYRRTHVSRAVNSNGKGRGKVGELLIVNPGIPGESGK
jgi:DNA adenine methylase